MPLLTSLLERLAPGLPRSVWLLQLGGFPNAFGNGSGGVSLGSPA